MKALITGATGFIGSRLALHMLDAGHEVRVLGQSRNPAESSTADLLRERGAEVVIGSITDPQAVRGALDGAEAVFHLAAAQHEANVPDRHFWEVNVEGTRQMLEASIEAGVRRFVHGSSIGVFGWSPGTTVSDDTPPEPDNIYGLTKLAGEDFVRSKQGAIEWVVLRISEVYGPGDRRLVKLFRGVRKRRFPMIGDGENLHHLVYIDDLIEGMLAAATRPEAVGKTVVLAGDKAISTNEMVQDVARLLRVKPPGLRIPMGPAMFVARTLERVLRPLGIQPPLHPRRMNFYLKSFSFKMPGTVEALGCTPKVDFPAGAAATARWYAEQGLD